MSWGAGWVGDPLVRRGDRGTRWELLLEPQNIINVLENIMRCSATEADAGRRQTLEPTSEFPSPRVCTHRKAAPASPGGVGGMFGGLRPYGERGGGRHASNYDGRAAECSRSSCYARSCGCSPCRAVFESYVRHRDAPLTRQTIRMRGGHGHWRAERVKLYKVAFVLHVQNSRRDSTLQQAGCRRYASCALRCGGRTFHRSCASALACGVCSMRRARSSFGFPRATEFLHT